jgi:CxxC motif-containing protein (DUF1111 family)
MNNLRKKKSLIIKKLISKDDILQYVDLNDKNKEGISGRTNQVWSTEYVHIMLGYYG